MKETKITKTISKVLPAVVSINIKKDAKTVEREFSHVNGKKNTFQIPEEKIDAHGMVQVDGGSGFFVDANGIILTNKHVISEPGGVYSVLTNDGREFPAELVARDPMNDVAILRVTAKEKFPYLKLGDSVALKLGMEVLTFGNALGLFENSVSYGIISGLSRSITAKTDTKRTQEMRGLIQTDAAINPGNSGGPLTNADGEVIGINTAIIAGAQNICFAIPVHTAKRDLFELKKHGKIRRPLLGVHYLLLNKDLQEKKNFPVSHGALVAREYTFEKAVYPHGPADHAGIKEGDIITEWNGKKITFHTSILDYLEESEVGEEITLTLLRDNEPLEKKLILGERK